MGLRRSRLRAARTRPRAIGRSPERRSISTGAISQGTFPPSRSRSIAALIAEGKLPGILGNRHASGTDDHRGARRGASEDRQADLLHLGRFGLPDRRARGGVRPRAALRPLPHRAAALRSAQYRPRHRAAVRRRKREGFRPHAPSQGFRRCRRPTAICCSAPRRPGAPSSRSARSATSSPIATPGEERKGKSNDGNVDLLVAALKTTADGGLVFVNLVDFDTEYGHRRDVPGFAACLEAFDPRLGRDRGGDAAGRLLPDHRRPRQRPDLPRLRPHARARADPRLRRPARRPARSARARSLADIAETIAAKLGLPKGPHGQAWPA